MDLKDRLDWYQENTWRTCPDLGSEGANLSHMTLGIGSEYSELLDAEAQNDTVNIAEEWADKNWYISNYCNFRNYSLSALWIEALEHGKVINFHDLSIKNYFYCLSKLQDLAKKNLAYGKEINKQTEKDYLLSLLVMIQWLAKLNEVDILKSLENNIAKLRVRFPDKFDKVLAVNRNLEAERIELEK